MWLQTALRTQPGHDQPPATSLLVTFGCHRPFLQYRRRTARIESATTRSTSRAATLNIQSASSRTASRVRFTPDVRPTTDASLDRNLALRLEYASLDVKVTDNVAIMFGLHEMPWLAFEESVNRYRVIGPVLLGTPRVDSRTDRSRRQPQGAPRRTEVHVGVYNGEGHGRAEIDKYKSIDGRATFRPFSQDSELGNVTISGFYQYGWYAQRSPAQRGHRDGQLRKRPTSSLTAQYLSATDNPFVAVDVERRGLSFFGEGRQGPTGWAGVGGWTSSIPDALERQRLAAPLHLRRRALEPGRTRALGCRRDARAGLSRRSNSQLLDRRLLAQTHIEF